MCDPAACECFHACDGLVHGITDGSTLAFEGAGMHKVGRFEAVSVNVALDVDSGTGDLFLGGTPFLRVGLCLM